MVHPTILAEGGLPIIGQAVNQFPRLPTTRIWPTRQFWRKAAFHFLDGRLTNLRIYQPIRKMVHPTILAEGSLPIVERMIRQLPQLASQNTIAVLPTILAKAS